MRYLLATIIAVLGVTSCSAPPPEKRVDIILRNTTDQPLELRSQMGPFGRTIKLQPGEVWFGWVPRQFAGNEIQIEVRPKQERRR